MKDKIVVITGGTSGIGKEIARALAHRGATVVVVGRDLARGAAATDQLRRSTGNEDIVFVPADLSSLADVRRLAGELTARFPRIHVLVNNAAVVRADRRTTVDGLEETLAVGHLAPVLLTELLLPVLTRSAPARIVNVTSGAVHRAQPALDDLHSDRGYHPLAAYGRAKLANLAWTLALARRLQGTGVVVFAADPGIADTGTHRDYPRPAIVHAVMRLVWLVLGRRLSVERAAVSAVRAASAPELDGRTGVPLDPKGRPAAPPAAALDEDFQRDVDRVSRELTDIDGGDPAAANPDVAAVAP